MFNVKMDIQNNLGAEIESAFVIPLQVSIGEVQVPLLDILNFTSGAELRFSLTDQTLVTLLLGGEPIATAELEVSGDEIKFKISEVFLNQEEKINDNQLRVDNSIIEPSE